MLYDSERQVVYVTCPMCGNEYEVPCTLEQWVLFTSEDRPHVQDIFPELSAEARELLISHICPSCWIKLFG